MGGAFYSCLLCALFLPTELYVRHAAFEMISTQSAGRPSRSERRKWLCEEGFEVSTVTAITRRATVSAPLIASVLQGVVAL